MSQSHDRAAAERTWRSAFAFLRRSPRFGFLFIRAKWISEQVLPRLERFLETKSRRDFARLAFFHPGFTLVHVLPNVRIRWSKKADAAGPADSTVVSADPSVPGNADAKLPGSATSDGEAEDADDPTEESITDLLAEAEQSYLNRQVVSAAIRVQDAKLFGGEDWDNDDVVRLMLRESYHDFVIPGSEQEHYIVFEPRLLLHRSGVVQLDLAIRVDDGPLNIRQVLSMMWGPEPRVVRSRMSVPLTHGTRWEGAANYADGEVDAGQPLGLLEHPVPVSMSDLLHVHLEAILSVIGRTCRHWMIFPTSFIDVEDCCGSPEQWRRTHREDLIRLATRGSADRRIAEHVEPPADLSMGRDHSLYATLGSAAYLEWEGEPPRGIAELDTVLVIEYALSVQERLRALEEAVGRMTLNERELRRRYRGAVRVFSDMRQRNLRSGEAREIVRKILEDSGAPEMRRTIETALDLSSTAYATRSSERSAQRSLWITLAATIVAFLVAIPPLREIFSSLPSHSKEEFWALGVLRWFANEEFWGPWLFMSAVAVALLAMWVAVRWWRVVPRRLPSVRRGFRWPTEFTVSADPWSPASGGPSETTLSASLGNVLVPAPEDDVEPPLR